MKIFHQILFIFLIGKSLLNASDLNVDPQREDINLQQEQVKGLQYSEDQNLQQERTKDIQFTEDQNLQHEQTHDRQFEEDKSFQQERELGR